MAILFSATKLVQLNLFNNGGASLESTTASAASHLNLLSSLSKERKTRGTVQTIFCSSIKPENQTKTQIQTHSRKHSNRRPPISVISQGREEDETHGLICPGCGVFMQDRDPNLPGFYQQKKAKPKIEIDEKGLEGLILDELDDGIVGNFENEKGLEVEEEDIDWGEDDEWGSEDESLKKELDSFTPVGVKAVKTGTYEKFEGGLDNGFVNEIGKSDGEEDFDWDEWENEDDEDEKLKKELDGFTLPGVGYGNITEETLEKGKKKKISKAEKKRKAREEAMMREESEAVTVCARCHSLRNYGQVKNQKAENLIPDFDFNRLITTRLMKPTGNSDASVLVMVVDCVDFDGSFPKRAARTLFKALEGRKKDAKLKLPKLVLVATKVDLLPSQVSPARLDRWVRNRAKANGAPKLSGVYLVSSRKDLGVRNLLAFVKEMAGPRGSVWVIGAQNAGKSTLINAFAKKEGTKITKLTEAAVPGTTLGILRITGVLPAKAKMYDTPGLLHPYLMSMRLNRDEQKMVEIRKELQPRTYRIKAGQAIYVGALMRLDLNQASVETIYVSVWASPNISLHLGKIENADEIWSKHAGIRLQPPIGEDRVSQLGQWEQKEFKVSGNSWDVNSIDIAIAGLGWFSLGLKGEATVTLWVYDGVEAILREPLVLDRASSLERPGFLLPKAVSDAIANQSKLEAEKKKQQVQRSDLLSEMVV